MVPSSPMMNVVRCVPMYVRPYIFFSPHTPNCSTRAFSVSAEPLVFFLVVNAYAYHFIPLCLQFAVVVAQVARLRGAARCHVLRVEIQHELLSLEVVKPYLVAVLVASENFRRFVSDVHFFYY